MTEIGHRFVESNSLSVHVAEAGDGPLVVLLHGFPETWYSWRHQIDALATAGCHAVAPDQRGYGRTGGPNEVDHYTQLDLVGDVVGLIDQLGEGPAVVVGHDWGAPVAWHTALLRPDLVRGVAGISIPYLPRTSLDMVSALESTLGPTNYQAYFQRVGVAEAELERDVETTIRRFYLGLSGGSPSPTDLVLPEGGGVLDVLADCPQLPPWLTAEDLAVQVGEFERSGFGRALNWYRNPQLTNRLMAPWTMVPVHTPALFVTGELDVVHRWPGMSDLVGMLDTFLPNLHDSVVIPGCGHWTGEEQPDALNDALLGFLAALA